MTVLNKAILAVSMCCAAVAARAEVVAPDALIRNTVEEVIAIIKQDKDIQAGDQKKIIALVDAKVLPHFDFARMTQLAVGKHWRAATPEQKQALDDATEAPVKTLIHKPGAQPIPVDYELKKAADGWKAFDISIEGVSMVMSYRGTFTTQIQESGIDGLIKILAD